MSFLWIDLPRALLPPGPRLTRVGGGSRRPPGQIPGFAGNRWRKSPSRVPPLGPGQSTASLGPVASVSSAIQHGVGTTHMAPIGQRTGQASSGPKGAWYANSTPPQRTWRGRDFWRQSPYFVSHLALNISPNALPRLRRLSCIYYVITHVSHIPRS